MQASASDRELVVHIAHSSLLALPGVLIIYFSFNAGGFYPNTTGVAAIVLALLLVVRVTMAEDPFAGFGWPLALAAAALAALAVWTLFSGWWSDAPARALIEFDRTLVYLLALVLFGSLPRTSERLRWIVRGMALGIAVVAVAGLLTRLLPETFPTVPNMANERLSYPLTYWNSLGILASIGVVLCVHLSASLLEPRAIRIAAAAAVPALACTVLFTFSRGGIGAGIIGLAVYVVAARPRGLATAAVAIVPAAVVALSSAYGADLLATARPTTTAAAAQGHDVAITVLACTLAAALIRAVLVPVDTRLRRLRLSDRLRKPVVTSAWAVCALAAVAVIVAASVPTRVADQYDRFVNTSGVRANDLRDRLTEPGNNGRIGQWKVARTGYQAKRLTGQGAGTFGLRWTRERPASLAGLVVRDAHSLYLETLDELGLVGFLLLAAAILVTLASFLPVNRGHDRSLYAALAAAGLMWAVHSGFDWDWEMPAVTAWVFAAGGAALATQEHSRERRGPVPAARIAIGLALLAGTVAPGVLIVSQGRLDDAAAAFERGDCRAAIRRAVESIEALEIRPEPYEALGFCQVRRGNPELAVSALERAVERDPDNWEFRYGLALMRGAAGLDPRRAARGAWRLNPRDELTVGLLRELRRGDRRRWRRLTSRLATRERLSVVR
jgi:O-antigen ligase